MLEVDMNSGNNTIVRFADSVAYELIPLTMYVDYDINFEELKDGCFYGFKHAGFEYSVENNLLKIWILLTNESEKNAFIKFIRELATKYSEGDDNGIRC